MITLLDKLASYNTSKGSNTGEASQWKAEWGWCLVLADDLLTDEKRNGFRFLDKRFALAATQEI